METSPQVPIHKTSLMLTDSIMYDKQETKECIKPLPLHIHNVLSIHGTLWFISGKDAQWNTLQCWMLLNKTKFHYINLEVPALQTLPRDLA